MKSTLKFMLLGLALVAQTSMAAEKQLAILIEEGGENMIVLGGETAGGEGAPAPTDELGFLDHFRVTYAAQISVPIPFTAGGGRVGISAFKDMIEVGAEAVFLSIPAGDRSMGLQLGGYLQLAPVPGSWGKRFYIRGGVYRVFATGTPSMDLWGASVGLGYRQPLDGGRFGELLGNAQYLFFELGLERDVLFTYQNDVLITPRMLTFGLAW